MNFQPEIQRNIRMRLKTAAVFFAALILFGLPASCSTKNPKAAGVFLERGIANIQQGQYTHALRELLDAKKFNPGDPVIHYYLGIAYYGKRLNKEAIAEFQEAIALKDDFSEAHNYLGTVYSEMGGWDDAIAEYQKAIDNILYETPSGALNNMGYAYYKKGDYPAALSRFDEAIAKEPKTPIVPLIEKNRGLTYFAQGRIKEAMRHLKKSLQSAPDFPETHYWLAKCYIELKDFKAASDEFRSVVRIAPESEFGLKAKEGLEAIAASRQ